MTFVSPVRVERVGGVPRRRAVAGGASLARARDLAEVLHGADQRRLERLGRAGVRPLVGASVSAVQPTRAVVTVRTSAASEETPVGRFMGRGQPQNQWAVKAYTRSPSPGGPSLPTDSFTEGAGAVATGSSSQ